MASPLHFLALHYCLILVRKFNIVCRDKCPVVRYTKYQKIRATNFSGLIFGGKSVNFGET